MAGRLSAAGAAGDPLDDFLAVSAALTGFTVAELQATGMGPAYLEQLMAVLGERLLARLLQVGGDAVHRAHDPEAELGRRVLADPDLGPPSQNLIVLWYTGQWVQLPGAWRDRHGASPRDVDGVLSPEAYSQGLVWNATGAHPQGAKPPGFATWVQPPRTRAVPAGS